MCLAIPGRLIETFDEHGLRMGKVDFGGVSKRVCLEHVREAQPGAYLLVHVGFALSILDEEEARHVFAFISQMDSLEGLREGATDEVSG